MKDFTSVSFPSITIKLIEANQQDKIEPWLCAMNIPSKQTEQQTLAEKIGAVALNQQSIFGVYDNNQLIGIIEWTEAYPTEKDACIQVFALLESAQQIELAQALYDALEQMTKELGYSALNLALSSSFNLADPFWETQRFVNVNHGMTQNGVHIRQHKNI